MPMRSRSGFTRRAKSIPRNPPMDHAVTRT
jgi:hypothetical protein